MMDGGRTWDVVEVLLAGLARLAAHFTWCFRRSEAAGMVCREAESVDANADGWSLVWVMGQDSGQDAGQDRDISHWTMYSDLGRLLGGGGGVQGFGDPG